MAQNPAYDSRRHGVATAAVLGSGIGLVLGLLDASHILETPAWARGIAHLVTAAAFAWLLVSTVRGRRKVIVIERTQGGS